MVTRNWLAFTNLNRLSHPVHLRLFCFPYAGGGASVFRTWAQQAPAGIEVCPVQLPGRENYLQEPPYTRLKPLVQALVPVIVPYLDRPFAFFGHSMGALISFELACRLRQQFDLKPVHLFVSGYRAPQLPRPNCSIHNLPESEFIEELRRLDGSPEDVLQNVELMELLLPVLRADFELCETYTYSQAGPLDCPLTAFGGWQDIIVGYEDLAAWREQTQASFRLQMYPGNHFFLNNTHLPLLRAVSQELAPHLNQKIHLSRVNI
jgi:medium-chain acyl-[acyl-carrier-protein] hydrolase